MGLVSRRQTQHRQARGQKEPTFNRQARRKRAANDPNVPNGKAINANVVVSN